MKVIQFRKNRIVLLGILCFFGLVLFGLIYSYYQVQIVGSESLPHRTSQLKDGFNVEESDVRETEDIFTPIFKGVGNLGNFEVPVDSDKIGPGEKGKPHSVAPRQRAVESNLKSVYGFNQLVSDLISINRTIPDMREAECKYWDYPTKLPKASVILVFHNEGWSTLFRTINSVINRSPSQFFKEIVLVDDKSELEHLHESLEKELEKPYYKNRVLLVRNKEREGLIRSRNNGAIAASGEVVIFLDAHCEVNDNWLPPLLAPIKENRKTLSVPVIDGINWNDFSINPVYAAGSHSRGIFEWGFLYKENEVPQREKNKRKHSSESYNAPTHAGGLFAIDREWFKTLGWYDPGLFVWGGENFELSFKTWMCGGRSVWVPCSKVAHVYRGHSCSSCHSGSLGSKFGGQPTTLRNYKRVIETWFDEEYKEFFYTREPLARFVDMGDISDQLKLKKTLNCKSFDWFMKEVAYDVLEKYPKLPKNKYWGELKNMKYESCLDTKGSHPPSKTSASGCHGFGGNQLFRLNVEGQLTSGEWCQDTSDNGKSIVIKWCEPGTVNGPWEYKNNQLIYKTTNKCLTINSQFQIVLELCVDGNLSQSWKWNTIKPHWAKS